MGREGKGGRVGRVEGWRIGRRERGVEREDSSHCKRQEMGWRDGMGVKGQWGRRGGAGLVGSSTYTCSQMGSLICPTIHQSIPLVTQTSCMVSSLLKVTYISLALTTPASLYRCVV